MRTGETRTQGRLFEAEATIPSPCCAGRRAVLEAPRLDHGCERIGWRCDCGAAGFSSRRLKSGKTQDRHKD
jgi:hypothetical protein